jgi:hypothetical protein
MNSCVMHNDDKFSPGDIDKINNTFVNPLTPEKKNEKNLTHINCPTVICVHLLTLLISIAIILIQFDYTNLNYGHLSAKSRYLTLLFKDAFLQYPDHKFSHLM